MYDTLDLTKVNLLIKRVCDNKLAIHQLSKGILGYIVRYIIKLNNALLI